MQTVPTGAERRTGRQGFATSSKLTVTVNLARGAKPSANPAADGQG